jgi:hypothetical protein
MRWLKHATMGTVAAVGMLLAAIQFAPYGRAHTNPPVRREPPWDTPATRELARRACFDCHSNETAWLWYTSVAPVSWLAQRDVDDSRRALNFSAWDRAQEEAVRRGKRSVRERCHRAPTRSSTRRRA